MAKTPTSRAQAPTALLPPAEKLSLLAPEIQREVLAIVDKANERNAGHAREALRLGVASFALCAGGFIYLLGAGHPVGAGVILGTGVVTIIVQIINSRV